MIFVDQLAAQGLLPEIDTLPALPAIGTGFNSPLALI
jgi:hypothetical protein